MQYAFVEIDFFQEHLNLWIKRRRIRHSWDWLAFASPAVNILRKLSTKINNELGEKQGSKYKIPDLHKDIAILMAVLKEHAVYNFEYGRVVDIRDRAISDVIAVGLAQLSNGNSTNPMNVCENGFNIDLAPSSSSLSSLKSVSFVLTIWGMKVVDASHVDYIRVHVNHGRLGRESGLQAPVTQSPSTNASTRSVKEGPEVLYEHALVTNSQAGTGLGSRLGRQVSLRKTMAGRTLECARPCTWGLEKQSKTYVEADKLITHGGKKLLARTRKAVGDLKWVWNDSIQTKWRVIHRIATCEHEWYKVPLDFDVQLPKAGLLYHKVYLVLSANIQTTPSRPRSIQHRVPQCKNDRCEDAHHMLMPCTADLSLDCQVAMINYPSTYLPFFNNNQHPPHPQPIYYLSCSDLTSQGATTILELNSFAHGAAERDWAMKSAAKDLVMSCPDCSLGAVKVKTVI
ncbi:hypothetical protein CVT26_001131 [Gymnopilus dilepis]|uniref:DUF6589 domain-containing protein n=1 Tax=Gymnopilus dilepis TaxID=231916 RepID=A0A409WBE5_9AGAR|nr:hypothetical protein CVT26_001131 [Gymnopilus dilepis]